MICLFSTSFSHGSNLSNLVRILFKLRDKLSHTASPSNMALVVYPPSPHIVQNSRELSVKGAQHRRFCGGLPLTGGTGCSISRRRGGGISSRAASFPMTGKGRGIGLNINGGLLMNFTNSPYERMMKEIPHKDIPAPQKAPEGTPCAGCPYWREIACVFCYQERLKKQS